MKKWTISIFILSFGLLILFLILNQKTDRRPSSLNFEKEVLISKLQWVIKEKDIEFNLDLNCEDWTSLEVTFKSEGVAYSGEPSRRVQASVCGDQSSGFFQIWPRDLMSENENIQKLGLSVEAPPAWTLEKIKLFGPLGTVEISSIEIYYQTGQVLIFETY